MLNLETIRARLAAQCAGLSSAKLSESFGSIAQHQACNLPQAFVGDYRETYRADGVDSVLTQPARGEFSVWIAVRRSVGSTGEVWQANITTVEGQVKSALGGWRMSASTGPVYVVSAGMERITKYTAFWKITFAADFIFTNTPAGSGC